MPIETARNLSLRRLQPGQIQQLEVGRGSQADADHVIIGDGSDLAQARLVLLGAVEGRDAVGRHPLASRVVLRRRTELTDKVLDQRLDLVTAVGDARSKEWFAACHGPNALWPQRGLLSQKEREHRIEKAAGPGMEGAVGMPDGAARSSRRVF